MGLRVSAGGVMSFSSAMACPFRLTIVPCAEMPLLSVPVLTTGIWLLLLPYSGISALLGTSRLDRVDHRHRSGNRLGTFRRTGCAVRREVDRRCARELHQ